VKSIKIGRGKARIYRRWNHATALAGWLDVAGLTDFGGGAEDQPALFAVHAGELFGEEAELAGGFLVEAPDGLRLLLRNAQFFDRSFVVGEKLVERNVQGARQFFESLDGRNGAAILQARKVAAKKAGALLDVALREVLGFAKPLEPFADHHGESLQYLAVPTQLLLKQKYHENRTTSEPAQVRSALARRYWHFPAASLTVPMDSGVLDDMRKVTLIEQI
jgi:hypothetical protein